MILNDRQIKSAQQHGDIVIQPFNEDQLGPNSYDIRLSKHLAVYDDDTLDMMEEPTMTHAPIPESGLTLQPGNLYLGTTKEVIGSETYVPMLEGRSSVGRLGMSIHETAGVGDLGFLNHWTLEITVTQPTVVYSDVRIGQILFYESQPAGQNYNEKNDAKYGERDPKPMASQIWEDFDGTNHSTT